MKKEYTITLEMIMALLQGKELHIIVDEEDFVFYPPQGTITMNKEQYENLKRNISAKSSSSVLKMLMDIESNNKKEE